MAMLAVLILDALHHDPGVHQLVHKQGLLLGTDGLQPLRARSRQVSSGWKVLDDRPPRSPYSRREEQQRGRHLLDHTAAIHMQRQLENVPLQLFYQQLPVFRFACTFESDIERLELVAMESNIVGIAAPCSKSFWMTRFPNALVMRTKACISRLTQHRANS